MPKTPKKSAASLAGAALARLGAGKPKKFSPESIEKRRKLMAEINKRKKENAAKPA